MNSLQFKINRPIISKTKRAELIDSLLYTGSFSSPVRLSSISPKKDYHLKINKAKSIEFAKKTKDNSCSLSDDSQSPLKSNNTNKKSLKANSHKKLAEIQSVSISSADINLTILYLLQDKEGLFLPDFVALVDLPIKKINYHLKFMTGKGLLSREKKINEDSFCSRKQQFFYQITDSGSHFLSQHDINLIKRRILPQLSHKSKNNKSAFVGLGVIQIITLSILEKNGPLFLNDFVQLMGDWSNRKQISGSLKSSCAQGYISKEWTFNQYTNMYQHIYHITKKGTKRLSLLDKNNLSNEVKKYLNIKYLQDRENLGKNLGKNQRKILQVFNTHNSPLFLTDITGELEWDGKKVDCVLRSLLERKFLKRVKKFNPHNTQINYQYSLTEKGRLYLRYKSSIYIRERYKEANAFQDLTEKELYLLISDKYPTLREFQILDIIQYIQKDTIANFNDVGLGKGFETACYLDLAKPAKVLIVVPNTMKYQWRREMTENFSFSMEDITLINGSAQKRKSQWSVLNNKRFIIITNYENLRTDDFHLNQLDKYMFDCVIFDEITITRNIKTDFYQICRQLKSKKVIGLSGTPLENRFMDIYGVISLLNPRFFSSPEAFTAHYIIGKSVKESSNLIAKALHYFDGLIRWKKEDVLTDIVPEIALKTIPVMFSTEERKNYEEIKKGKVEVRHKNGKSMNPKELLNKIQVLIRFCSDSSIYLPNTTSSKKEAFMELIKELPPSEKILVFSHHRDIIFRYSAMLTKAGIKNYYITGKLRSNYKREKLLYRFQSDENAHVLLCTDTFAQGKNIQFCSVLINIDQHWNPSVIKQRIGRIHRIGQTGEKITVYSFLCKDTIEERIYQKIQEKNLIFTEIIGANEKILEELSELFLE